MTTAIIAGYGYCGYYLSRTLLKQNTSVLALSRTLQPEFKLAHLQRIAFDINEHSLPEEMPESVLYYFVPPINKGKTDTVLQRFLALNKKPDFTRVVYCGSSGVYGNHQGKWVNEFSECRLISERQYRRMDAEQQWQKFCARHNIPLVILRVGGIYGPERLPIRQCTEQSPVLIPAEAPFINHIFVNDLVDCLLEFGQNSVVTGVFNIADGQPLPMGQFQQILAECLKLPLAEEFDFKTIWEQASPMKREFMESNKRLCIDKILQAVPSFRPTPIKAAIRQILKERDSL